MSGGGGGGGSPVRSAGPFGMRLAQSVAGAQAPSGSTLRVTPEMLGLRATATPYGEGLLDAYGAGTIQTPWGQTVSAYGGAAEDMQNALALAYMYDNLSRLGYMQPQGGTAMPQAPMPQPAQPAQPALAPPPTEPSVPAMTPLMPYASMLGPAQGVNIQGLPANMAAAIPAYLRRGA
jgi:hypothetical protein